MNWAAVLVTVKLATLTTLILVVIGLPIAYWLAFSRWRWKFLLKSVVALPLVLPPTVLGFYILVIISPRNPVGAWYQKITEKARAFTFEGLVLASVLYSLPFVVQPLTAAFASVDRRLIEASWTLGISACVTFFRIILPLSGLGLITGAVLGFAHTVGEFGVVLMVGGNIPRVTRTISIDIYDQVQALNYTEAAQTSLALLIFSFLLLSTIYAMNQKRRRRVWTGPIE